MSNPFDAVEFADNPDMIECPKCGIKQEDFDGFGVLYCEACGYCTHASVNGTVCTLCGNTVHASTAA